MGFKGKLAAFLLVLVACGLLVVSTGCGKKGLPKPPPDNTAPEK